MTHAKHTAGLADFVARRDIVINAPPEAVWKALTDNQLHSRIMFGAEVETDWQEGSPITWRGEWQGKSFEDKGEILQLSEERELKMTHYSAMSGQPDEPDNYHVVDIKLEPDSDGTLVALSQDNNPNQDAADHAGENWAMMLKNLKDVVEAG